MVSETEGKHKKKALLGVVKITVDYASYMVESVKQCVFMEEKLLGTADEVAVAFEIAFQSFCEGEGKIAVCFFKAGNIRAYEKRNFLFGNVGEHMLKHYVLIEAKSAFL